MATKKKVEETKAEREFLINSVKVTDATKIAYIANPKRKGSQAHARYEKYGEAKTIEQYFKLNVSKAAMADLRHDLNKEFLTIS